MSTKFVPIHGLITSTKRSTAGFRFNALREEGVLPETCTLRTCKYSNNIVEQDHRFIKRLVRQLEEIDLPELRRIGLRFQGVPRGVYLPYVTLGTTQKTES